MEKKSSAMFEQPLCTDRVRTIDGGFAFIPHRFLRDGFLAALTLDEMLLYFFLCLAADRHGISFYRHESIGALLHLEFDPLLLARQGLIAKDLVAFDGRRFQVLSLPDHPALMPHAPLCTEEDFESHDPATIRNLICSSMGLTPHGR